MVCSRPSVPHAPEGMRGRPILRSRVRQAWRGLSSRWEGTGSRHGAMRSDFKVLVLVSSLKTDCLDAHLDRDGDLSVFGVQVEHEVGAKASLPVALLCQASRNARAGKYYNDTKEPIQMNTSEQSLVHPYLELHIGPTLGLFHMLRTARSWTLSGFMRGDDAEEYRRGLWGEAFHKFVFLKKKTDTFYLETDFPYRISGRTVRRMSKGMSGQ